MPEGVGYGNEVASTTKKKVITKKAVPQKKPTADPPIHPETPTPTGIPLRPRGDSPEAIREFQKQVMENVSDPATQRDIFQAANVPLPGVGLSSKTPPKHRGVAREAKEGFLRGTEAMKEGLGEAARAITGKKRKKVKRRMPPPFLSPKARRAGELQRAGPAGKETRRKEDAMKAGGFTRAEVGAFQEMEGQRLLRKRKKSQPVYETEQPGP